MSYEPDEWAKNWLEKQRAKGKNGLTVEKRGGSHIVRSQKLVKDESGKRCKESEYLGVLTPDGTIMPPKPRVDRITIIDIKDAGSAKLLEQASERIHQKNKKAFPYDYREIIELAFSRCLDRGELKNAGKCWKRLDDVLGLRPNTSPKSLSETLSRIGRSRGSQDMFFETVHNDDKEMAVDMSVIFSKARGATLSKKGYNRFRTAVPHVNLVLTCGLTEGRPQYMNVVPGNVKEGAAVNMLDEFGLEEGTVLVMDRAYCNSGFLSEVKKRKFEYIVAARRNSKAYNEVIVGGEMFKWRNSAIRYGKSVFGDGYAYRFENLSQRNAELVDSLAAEEKGRGRGPDIEKAGNFMIFSSMDMDAKNVYRIYKTRCTIEERFDAAKNCLSADRMYMHDDEHMLGHLFITFVSLQIWMEISDIIDKADMLGSYSVRDILDTYSVMKNITANGLRVEQTVPKDVRELDEKLGLYMFTEPGVKKKRGRTKKENASS
jgi:hypothetical protein